jgi:hypothetical protein
MANGTAASEGHRSCKQNHPNEAPIRELEPRYEHKQCNLTAASRGVNEARERSANARKGRDGLYL